MDERKNADRAVFLFLGRLRPCRRFAWVSRKAKRFLGKMGRVDSGAFFLKKGFAGSGRTSDHALRLDALECILLH